MIINFVLVQIRRSNSILIKNIATSLCRKIFNRSPHVLYDPLLVSFWSMWIQRSPHCNKWLIKLIKKSKERLIKAQTIKWCAFGFFVYVVSFWYISTFSLFLCLNFAIKFNFRVFHTFVIHQDQFAELKNITWLINFWYSQIRANGS